MDKYLITELFCHRESVCFCLQGTLILFSEWFFHFAPPPKLLCSYSREHSINLLPEIGLNVKTEDAMYTKRV